MRTRTFLAIAAGLACFGANLRAQSAGPHIPLTSPRAAPPPGDGSVTNRPAIEPLGSGRFRIGQVVLDQPARTVSFPATLNMTNGIVEYALVSVRGKVHESILRTEAEPYEIHVAMLLAGANSAQAHVDDAAGPGGQIDQPDRQVPPGIPVAIEVVWQTSGPPVRRKLAELVENIRTRQPPAGDPWVYNGSLVAQGKFLAQLSGSVVSLITDREALVNNSSDGHEDDTLWQVNPRTIPPARLPVQVSIRLLPRPAEPAGSAKKAE